MMVACARGALTKAEAATADTTTNRRSKEAKDRAMNQA
jgi:hypothetical protein